MKLIKSSFEILEQGEGLEGIYKQIELAGRTCYKSEDKITENSAKKFVDKMINNGHLAMLEHGTVYLKWNRYLDTQYTTKEDFEQKYNLRNKYILNPFSKCNTICTIDDEMDTDYITTNLRVLVENGWLDDLKYLCKPTVYHKKRVCVKFICDRGVSHEFVRHRVFSFAQESTRYCNYSKSKFGNELTFIEPSWNMNCYVKDVMIDTFKSCEASYLALTRRELKPQQARQILPNALKTELVMTGFVKDWKHFFELRCDSHAHPDAQYLANGLKEEFFKEKNTLMVLQI